ncbi:hypothetical protein [Mesorhizobium sp. KR9-304]|uniref:hypothetical protein n=1 Tax=Mesorhizobium sp. KR9-304 TaxID=3156614 RepID=UPI0032B526B7
MTEREFVAAFRQIAAALSPETPAEVDKPGLADLPIHGAGKRAGLQADIPQFLIGHAGYSSTGLGKRNSCLAKPVRGLPQSAWAAGVNDDGHGRSNFSGAKIRFDDFLAETTFIH